MYEEKKVLTEISSSVHLLLKVPKMQLFRLTVKYLVQQNIFNFFFFHLKKNVNPGGVDIISQGVTPQIFLIDVYLYKGIFFFSFLKYFPIKYTV